MGGKWRCILVVALAALCSATACTQATGPTTVNGPRIRGAALFGDMIPNAINSPLSGAGNLQAIILTRGRHNISFSEVWDGTLSGTPQIWTSGNFLAPASGSDAAAEAAADWDLVTDPSITAFLSAAPPTGGMPSGSPGDGSLYMPVLCAAVRWRVTWVSGSGNYRLHVHLN